MPTSRPYIVVTSLVLATVCFFASHTIAEDVRPFAGSLKTNQDVEAMLSTNILHTLLKGDKNLQEWADELEKTEPKTLNDIWITYLVSLRAGRDETACKMIPLLFNAFDSRPLELQEEEKALRKALSLYDTPELRLRGPTPSHRSVLGALLLFFRKAERLNDAGELFFRQHEIVKDEPIPLRELYYVFDNLPVTIGRKDEFLQLLKEDISKAGKRYQSAVESGEPKDIQGARDGLNLMIGISPAMAVSMGIFDLENNPFSLDILKAQDNTSVRDQIIRAYLFGEEGQTDERYEKKLEILRTALEQKKLPVECYTTIGEAIRINASSTRKPEGYKTAISFYEGAVRNIDQFLVNDSVKRSNRSSIASCSMELGDWRNGEKYTIESFMEDGLQESELRSWLNRAADIAEKSGEAAEAKRIRALLGNLGLFEDG